MSGSSVGIIGARSPSARHLIRRLVAERVPVTAFSRQVVDRREPGLTWAVLGDSATEAGKAPTLPRLVVLAPIWELPRYFANLEAWHVERLVAISSTSRFTKVDSTSGADAQVASQLAEGERAVADWAKQRNVALTILRPTLIYGGGDDRNLAEVASFIRKFGFFPLLGKAGAQRQPIHVEDVAGACYLALKKQATPEQAYNISGGEVIIYREMIARVFRAMDKSPRLISIPLWVFSMGVAGLRLRPHFRSWTSGMAERMNKDMVFDHSAAKRDLGFEPRPFILTREDVTAADAPIRAWDRT